MTALANPEAGWIGPRSTRELDRHEVVRRIGEVCHFEVLEGGRANCNVRIDGERVLRIYRRDKAAAAREACLLAVPWRNFRVPRLLDQGEDWLVLEYVRHAPLCDGDGAVVGRALAEIHGWRSFSQAGFLGPGLDVVHPLPDLLAAVREHVASGRNFAAVRDAVVAFLTRHHDELAPQCMRSVLVHGDFKVANVYRSDGQALVLDWEFAYAGPSLMDVGQMLRWGVPDRFRDAFASAYVDAGGVLPEDWARLAERLDLVNLIGLLDGAAVGSRRATDLLARIAVSLGRSVR